MHRYLLHSFKNSIYIAAQIPCVWGNKYLPNLEKHLTFKTPQSPDQFTDIILCDSDGRF